MANRTRACASNRLPILVVGPFLLATCGSPPVSETPGIAATAEIRGCGDAEITGQATLHERPSEEGVKL
ncbi:MAG: hypothetical protein WBO43_06340, partial [Gemmatimonadota bacterium]